MMLLRLRTSALHERRSCSVAVSRGAGVGAEKWRTSSFTPVSARDPLASSLIGAAAHRSMSHRIARPVAHRQRDASSCRRLEPPRKLASAPAHCSANRRRPLHPSQTVARSLDDRKSGRIIDRNARRGSGPIAEIGEKRSELARIRAFRVTLALRSGVGLSTEQSARRQIGEKRVESHRRVARCSNASASLNACRAERSTVDSGRASSGFGAAGAADDTPSDAP